MKQHSEDHRNTLLLGAHMPTSGGLHKAVEHIAALRGSALQIFSKNQRQWRPAPLTPEAVADFHKARKAWGNYPIVSHDSYLINLAGTDPVNLEKSIGLFVEEIRRAAALGISLVVTHRARISAGERLRAWSAIPAIWITFFPRRTAPTYGCCWKPRPVRERSWGTVSSTWAALSETQRFPGAWASVSTPATPLPRGMTSAR